MEYLIKYNQVSEELKLSLKIIFSHWTFFAVQYNRTNQGFPVVGNVTMFTITTDIIWWSYVRVDKEILSEWLMIDELCVKLKNDFTDLEKYPGNKIQM